MKGVLIALGVIVLLCLLVGGNLIGSRNELVTEREGIKNAFSQVDVQLQRRNDLIPNLVASVKGFAAHEQSAIDSVTKARAAMMGAQTPAEKIDADRQVSGALSRLFAITENYPQLKADQNFLALQDELAGTENRIAQERRKYNETVRKYNVDIELFPKNIAASMFGFRQEDAYFKAETGAKDVPKVAF